MAIASLIKLINLMGAEMLVGKHRDDVDAFEQSVRAKLYAHIEGASPKDTAAGVALAHSLIEPVLANLRERVRQNEAASLPPFAAPPSAYRRLN
ncbi:MAG: hypothetical protein KGM15_16835 [Pseudomonadota bacterium]|nr:hypothetical protein [Pseudomonadota bacterium]